MIKTKKIPEQLFDYGWIHDPINKCWRNGTKIFDYKDIKHTTLYILAGTGEHYATWITAEEFALFGLWLASYII